MKKAKPQVMNTENNRRAFISAVVQKLICLIIKLRVICNPV